MARRPRSNGRQIHPRGPLLTVDDAVRNRVRKALDERGWEQKDLAAKLSVAPATITNLLKPGPPRQIKYLTELYRVLGIQDQLQEVVVGWPDLPSEVRDVIVALVASRKRNR